MVTCRSDPPAPGPKPCVVFELLLTLVVAAPPQELLSHAHALTFTIYLTSAHPVNLKLDRVTAVHVIQFRSFNQ